MLTKGQKLALIYFISGGGGAADGAEAGELL
jgi:hypothetical protein